MAEPGYGIPAGVARLASILSRLFERSARVFLDRMRLGRIGSEGFRDSLRGLEGDIGLYIHTPFCHEPLCRFCCFVRYPYREAQARAYRRAVLREIEEQAAAAENAKPTSIYVGGGTPSIDPWLLAEILDHARASWGAAGAVVSVEANPRDVDDEFVSQARGRVQRLSLGAQALTPQRLRAMGRLNSTVEDVYNAIEAAAGKFETLNVDIVWGLPGEGPAEVREEARRAFRLRVDQVTFYPIMPTPATRAMVVAGGGGPWSPLDPENYSVILEEAAEADYRPSTPWCMSRDKASIIDEYVVDTPWFVAAGPSGITRLPGLVAANTFRVEDYAARVEKTGLAAHYAAKPTVLEDALYVAQSALFGLRWSPSLLAEEYGATGAMVAAYVTASLLLLGEQPRGGSWRIERPGSLYALHRAQHTLYTALAHFRHQVLATEKPIAGTSYSYTALPAPGLQGA